MRRLEVPTHMIRPIAWSSEVDNETNAFQEWMV